MNNEFDSNFDDILYDQDIGVEFRIEIPEMKYEPATNLEDVSKTEVKSNLEVEELNLPKMNYETTTKIEDVLVKEENNELKEIEKENVLNKYKREEAKEENNELKEIEKESILNKYKREEAKEENNELKEIKKENALNKYKKEEVKEEIKIKPEKKEKKKTSKKTISKEKKPNTRKKTKVDNSYTEGSTYLIILVIVISIASISLLLTTKKARNNSKIIELYGNKTIILNEKDKYNEPGFIAIDFNQGDVTKNVIVKDNIDANVPGIYEVTYELSSENVKVTRNVIVTNDNDIDFKLSGDSTIFSKLNTEYVENGYQVSYNNRDYSDKVERFEEVDLNKPGLYKLYYVVMIDGNVKALTRNVVVYAGDIIDLNEKLVKEINNNIIDEIHYSNEITIDNVNSSVLLYFGALNCNDLSIDGINTCLNELFKVNTINLKDTTKYTGKNAEISFDKNTNRFVIKKLNLPNNLDNLYKVIVEGDNIYVYEKYAYEVLINNKEICDGKTKKLLYSGVDRNTQTGYETCTKACDSCEIARDRHYTETLYMHTFKKVADKYIWFKTEMIK